MQLRSRQILSPEQLAAAREAVRVARQAAAAARAASLAQAADASAQTAAANAAIDVLATALGGLGLGDQVTTRGTAITIVSTPEEDLVRIMAALGLGDQSGGRRRHRSKSRRHRSRRHRKTRRHQ